MHTVANQPTSAAVVTLADGIAVKRPGELTRPLVEHWLDDVVVVDEDAIADAIVLLMERAKLYVEGAGAVGVAALMSGRATPARVGTTCVVLSGGNVDLGVLPGLIRRHETKAGRRLILFVRISDRPGGLAQLLTIFAERGANLIEVALAGGDRRRRCPPGATARRPATRRRGAPRRGSRRRRSWRRRRARRRDGRSLGGAHSGSRSAGPGRPRRRGVAADDRDVVVAHPVVLADVLAQRAAERDVHDLQPTEIASTGRSWRSASTHTASSTSSCTAATP